MVLDIGTLCVKYGFIVEGPLDGSIGAGPSRDVGGLGGGPSSDVGLSDSVVDAVCAATDAWVCGLTRWTEASCFTGIGVGIDAGIGSGSAGGVFGSTSGESDTGSRAAARGNDEVSFDSASDIEAASGGGC